MKIKALGMMAIAMPCGTEGESRSGYEVARAVRGAQHLSDVR